MAKIISFISAHMGFLWRGARYQIVDSEVSTVNGGNAFLVLESVRMRIKILNDRDELSLFFQPISAHAERLTEWSSVELIRWLIEGDAPPSGILDARHAEFVGEHLDTIEDCFSPERWPTTNAKLGELKRLRSRGRGW